MTDDLQEWANRGIALLNAADPIGAIYCFRRACAISPTAAEVHYNIGLAFEALDKQDEAIASYRRSLQLKPDFAEACVNLGNVYLKRRMQPDAKKCYEQAVMYRPSLGQAHFNLGMIVKSEGNLDIAAGHFEKAWRISTANERAWDELRDCLVGLKRHEDAIKIFEEFESHAMPSAKLLLYGLTYCRRMGSQGRESRYLEMLKAWEFTQDDAATLSEILGCIQYFDLDQKEILRLYETYNRLIEKHRAQQVPLLPPRRTAGSKFRIGYLSPDFNSHVMGMLILEVLQRHDRERFEIYAYSLRNQVGEDAVTTRIRALTNKFVGLSDVDDQAAAKLIAEDDLDLLVDLGAHTAFARPPILAYRPARVQVTHLAYPGAIGLNTVDFKLTDQYADLPENDKYLIESLLPIDGCIFPLRRVRPDAQYELSRSSLNLEGKIVFGAFVNIMKLSPRCLKTWQQILQRVPNAMLAFSPTNGEDKPSFMRQLNGAGIDSARVIFIPRPATEHAARARYSLIDIVLDTFPYSGGDTTLAAVDMAIPVVSLCGRRHSERTSFSILMNLGVSETIVFDEVEYANVACRLAMDREYRIEVQNKMRRALESSTLIDTEAHVAALESAYLRAIASKHETSERRATLRAGELQTLFQQAIRLHQSGEISRAEVLYLQVLADQPKYVPVCYLYAQLLSSRGETEAAAQWIETALEIAPNFEDALLLASNLYLEQGRFEDAVACANRVTALNQRSHAAQNIAALGQMKLGHVDQAIAAMRAAVVERPDNHVYQFNLGVACQKARLLQDAASAYNRAIALHPNYVEAEFNLGVVFQDAEQWTQAEARYRKVLEIKPDDQAAYANLGEVLFASGQINAWLQNFRQFEKIAPKSFRLAVQAIEALQYLGLPGEAERYVNGLLANDFLAADVTELIDGLEQLLFPILYFDLNPGGLHGLYQIYNSALCRAFPDRIQFPATRKPGKIRIGYLSADMNDHVMGKMMYEAIIRHDHSRFEINCYSLSPRADAWTEKFRGASDKYLDLSKYDEHTAAETIAEDQLDILVDLSSHTRGAMPGILALKPARVQITHVANAGPVGLETIDFKLTDQFADLPENQDDMLESLLPVEGCVYPYRHVAPAKQHQYRREILGIPPGAFVIGAFFTPMKLSTRCLKIWRAVLDRIPNAVLAFSPLRTEARDAYIRLARAAGIEASRIGFIPASNDEAQNQARYNVVDIVLDSFPYNGVNGTIEALNMGIPVVAMVGKRHCERTSFSILTNLGVTQTIAQSGVEYVEIGYRLATDKAFYAGVVEAIRRGLSDSTFVNMEGHVANLEAAYIKALKQKSVI